MLLNVVASPNSKPEPITSKSCVADVDLLTLRLLVNKRQPAKLSKAHELSAYGADRKMPAGDIICSEAVVKAKPKDWVENRA